MFKMKRSDESPQRAGGSSAAPPAGETSARPGTMPDQNTVGKGRPTPTRREAEAARKRPLVPADRKEAKRRDRDQMRDRRYKARAAMEAGEEWALPPKDRGPQRQFVRDFIDARWSFAEFLLPILVLGLPVTLITNRTAMLVGYTLVYGAMVLAILDTAWLWFQVKRAVRARFGEDPQRGTLWYVITRAMQIRPGRLPKPRVKRGQYPHKTA